LTAVLLREEELVWNWSCKLAYFYVQGFCL